MISYLSLLRMDSFFSEASISAIDFTRISSPLALVAIFFKGLTTCRSVQPWIWRLCQDLPIWHTFFPAPGSYCEWRDKAFDEDDEGYVKYIWNNSYLYCGMRWKASSFQLLKLENLLRWSHFTFISYRSTNMNYFIYISHKFTAREDMNSINWPCSQCVAS